MCTKLRQQRLEGLQDVSVPWSGDKSRGMFRIIQSLTLYLLHYWVINYLFLKLFRKCMEFVNRPELSGRDPEAIFNNFKMCENHFSADQKYATLNNKSNRVKTAVPNVIYFLQFLSHIFLFYCFFQLHVTNLWSDQVILRKMEWRVLQNKRSFWKVKKIK